MTKTEELKPCPFCNPRKIRTLELRSVVRITKGKKLGVACIEPSCKVSPYILADTQEEADDIWNTRADLPRQQGNARQWCIYWHGSGDEPGAHLHYCSDWNRLEEFAYLPGVPKGVVDKIVAEHNAALSAVDVNAPMVSIEDIIKIIRSHSELDEAAREIIDLFQPLKAATRNLSKPDTVDARPETIGQALHYVDQLKTILTAVMHRQEVELDNAAAPVDVDKLANFIRTINGNNDMGHGALAEAIVDHLIATGVIKGGV